MPTGPRIPTIRQRGRQSRFFAEKSEVKKILRIFSEQDVDGACVADHDELVCGANQMIAPAAYFRDEPIMADLSFDPGHRPAHHRPTARGLGRKYLVDPDVW